MIVIGLTGSIGMGKSTTAQILRNMGIPVNESDAVVHALLQPGGDGFAPVADLFPAALKYDEKGRPWLDRRMIGDVVFFNAALRKKLEDILHPLVKKANDAFLVHSLKKKHKIAVLDIPLLFEVGAEDRVDVIFVVSAPKCLQRRRVLARPGMTEEKFAAILAMQMPDAEKRRRADCVIPTGFGRVITWLYLKRALKALALDAA